MGFRIIFLGLAAVAALAGSTGCAQHRGEVARVADETQTTAASTPAAAPTRVDVTPRLRMTCNLPDEPREAPKFGFDEIDLRERGEDILHQVGVCLTTGPLAGKAVCITGYADPRGTPEYNYNLGLARGFMAMHFIERFGVRPQQITVTSRGESEARGTDEASWAMDRRVEVDLADGANCAGANSD